MVLPDASRTWPFQKVWLMVTVEEQDRTAYVPILALKAQYWSQKRLHDLESGGIWKF